MQLGDTISQDQADAYLVNESTLIATRVEKLVTVPLNQNQFDALVSLAYNIGVGAFADSTLLRELNQSDFQGAAEQFLVWNK